MADLDKDFDLLAGHDLGQSRAVAHVDEEDPEKMDVLVWHKLETVGYQPSAREGHTAVTNGFSVLVFGGFEAGQRVNSLLSLEVTSCSWSIVPTKGDIPCPRSYHAANRYRNLMIVHGGEGRQEMHGHAQVSFDTYDQMADASRSIDNTSHPTLPPMHSQSTSVLNVPTMLETRPVVGHDGVTLGDSLCGTKLPGQMKLARGTRTQALSSTSATLGQGAALGSTVASNAGASTVGPAATTTGTTTAPPQTCCLDDAYVLDTISMEWYQLRCILSPLPRKGHTLSMLPLQGVEHAVIFGGYSIENVTLSNSLHVCEVSMIYDHYIARRDLSHRQKTASQSGAQSTHMGVIKALKQEQIEPIMWRTLSTSGTPPSPRYRHSSTLIHSADQTPLLVIMGGIGRDASVALSDVHILNLDTLHWTEPLTGSDALAQGIGGDGPVAGLYGHVAFAVSAMGDSTGAQSELLVFGGSSNPNSSQSNCNQSIFAFNLETHTWRRVPTGYAFPSGRANHSAALVQGWAPVHDTPGAVVGQNGTQLSASGRPRPGVTVNAAAMTTGATTALAQSTASNSVCAVVFGGLDSIQCASDTWALDLKWRKAGVEQYDACVSQREAQALQQPHIATSEVERSYLQAPGLLTREQNASLRSLIDSTGNLTQTLRTSVWGGSVAASPLQQFRKVRMDRSYDMSLEQGQPTEDRNKKQSINSRRYSEIAAGTPLMSTATTTTVGNKHGKTGTGTGTGSGRGSKSGDFMRSSSQNAADFVREADLRDGSAPASPSAQPHPHSLTEDGSAPQSPTATEPAEAEATLRPRSDTNSSLNVEFQNYAIRTRDYKLPGTTSEQLEIGTAFLKVRKDRAQTELTLQRERERNIAAEAAIVDQAAEILRLQQQLEEQAARYDTDTAALRRALQESQERERYLKELSDEAYDLLTLYGVRKV